MNAIFGRTDTGELVVLPTNEDGVDEQLARRRFKFAPGNLPLIPYLSMPEPAPINGSVWTSEDVWMSDRVERTWISRPMTAEELAASARKVWPTVAAFNGEFSNEEQLAIIASTHPAVKLVDRKLLAWRGEVHSDHPDVIQGLDILEAVQILTPERRAQICAPDLGDQAFREASTL